MYEMYLPFPPSVNNYYVKTRNGVFISKKGKAFRESISAEINAQLPGIHLDEKMIVEVVLYAPDKRKRDLDNYMKSLLDAITHSGLWEDDSLIDQLFIYRGEVVKPSGHVFVRIGDAGPVLPTGVALP